MPISCTHLAVPMAGTSLCPCPAPTLSPWWDTCMTVSCTHVTVPMAEGDVGLSTCLHPSPTLSVQQSHPVPMSCTPLSILGTPPSPVTPGTAGQGARTVMDGMGWWDGSSGMGDLGGAGYGAPTRAVGGRVPLGLVTPALPLVLLVWGWRGEMEVAQWHGGGSSPPQPPPALLAPHLHAVRLLVQ